VGASGGTGRAAVARLMAEGHTVTAFSRSASRLANEIDGLAAVDGDVTDPSAVERAVAGQDVVIVTLGIAENPLRVRLLGPARTPRDVRSRGTRNVIAAMRRHGVTRLVVQSSYGVGEARRMKVARASVARFLATAARTPDYVGATVAVSG
jgi:nucleoside-diphosphate-sugar epimerase